MGGWFCNVEYEVVGGFWAEDEEPVRSSKRGREGVLCVLREVLFLIAPSGGLFRPSNIY